MSSANIHRKSFLGRKKRKLKNMEEGCLVSCLSSKEFSVARGASGKGRVLVAEAREEMTGHEGAH